MFSAKSILAFFCVMLLAFVSAAPNRVLMRFGKRAAQSAPLGYRFVPESVPLMEYYESLAPQDNF